MSCRCRPALLSALLLLVVGSAQGQFVTLVTDFEDPAWTPFVTVVMFRDPSLSGTTRGLDPAVADAGPDRGSPGLLVARGCTVHGARRRLLGDF